MNDVFGIGVAAPYIFYSVITVCMTIIVLFMLGFEVKLNWPNKK